MNFNVDELGSMFATINESGSGDSFNEYLFSGVACTGNGIPHENMAGFINDFSPDGDGNGDGDADYRTLKIAVGAGMEYIF